MTFKCMRMYLGNASFKNKKVKKKFQYKYYEWEYQ